MTKSAKPTKKEWHNLYAAMAVIKKLAPWEWMHEDDIFGVQHPEQDEIGYVSVMGTLGEHIAVAVYLGVESLEKFWMMHDGLLPGAPEIMFETAQLQASFEDRSTLTDRDRKLKKSLGLKFRGKQAWPYFRSYRPGYFPWYLEADEARYLTAVLEQTAIVAQKFKDDPGYLEPEDELSLLVRVPRPDGDTVVWEDSAQEVGEFPQRSLELPIPQEAMTHLMQQPMSSRTVEANFFWTPSQIQDERGERPYFGYNLLVVDHQSGFIIGTQLLAPKPTFYKMLEQIPGEFIKLLARVNLRPSKLYIYPSLYGQLLSLAANDLGTVIEEVDYLHMVEEAKEGLLGFLNR